MKTFFRIAAAAALFAAMTACDAFHSLTKSRLKTAQGSPYELIVVCPQQEWTGELGDTLRSILTAPVPYLNQTEPLFDVLRVTERGFTGMVADHRNILKIVEDPSLAATNIAVQYDVTAEPQIVLTLQVPTTRRSPTTSPSTAKVWCRCSKRPSATGRSNSPKPSPNSASPRR